MTYLLLFNLLTVSAQNLFDCQHSLAYADYLFSVKDYQKAANEYERVLFGCDTTVVRERLLVAYRLSGQYNQSFQQLARLYPTLTQAPTFANEEYIKLLLLTKQYQRTDSLLTASILPPGSTIRFKLQSQLLRSQWKLAGQTLQQTDSILIPERSDYSRLIYQAEHIRQKSPFIAASLSLLVPGLGKVYTKDWKDGIVSFLFVGILAFQAGRSFNQRGPESVAGWAYTSVDLGFYLGNVYGSYKSARQFNEKQHRRLHEEVRRLSFDNF